MAIESLTVTRPSSSARLALKGIVAPPKMATNVSAFASLTWQIIPPAFDLDADGVTSTGRSQLNLVLLPNVLQPGASYRFVLTAHYPGAPPRTGIIDVLVNRPPWNGSFVVEYVAPATALSTTATLRAIDWTDDDLPLSYVFAQERAPSSSDALEASAPTVISTRSTQSTYLWRVPPGNRTLFCYVYDALGARAVSAAYRLEVASTRWISPALGQSILVEIKNASASGNAASSTTLASAFAITLVDIERQIQREGSHAGELPEFASQYVATAEEDRMHPAHLIDAP